VTRTSFALGFLAVGLALVLAGPARAGHYVCPPCNAPCDELSSDAPGICPKCGITLVEATSAAATPHADGRTNVAILIFDGVEIIDSMGPYEVFGAAGFHVYTVGATRQAVRSAMGQSLVPAFTFADAPAPDVLVVPGGGVYGAQHDAATLEFVRNTTAKTTITMSVCNGAFILAQAGLLDGLGATTTAGNLARLRTQFPKIDVVDDQRYVDNGHIITTGGLSAGIDGALHVIDREFGRPRAEQIARGIEYRWDPTSKWTRSVLADMRMPDVKLPEQASWEMQMSNGDTEHWEMHGRLTVSMTQEEALDFASKQVAVNGWKLQESSAGKRTWIRKDREGQAWLTTLTARPADTPSTYLETMTVKKVKG